MQYIHISVSSWYPKEITPTQRFGIPIPVQERDYLFYTPLQASPGAHPASCKLGTELLARVKVIWPLNTSRAEGEGEYTYTSTSVGVCMTCYGETFTFTT